MKDSNMKYALGENKILRNTYCPFLINMHYAFQVFFTIIYPLDSRKLVFSYRLLSKWRSL